MSRPVTGARPDLAGLLTVHATRGGSGVLKVTRGKLKRVFCLRRGRLAFVASNLIEEQLDEFLEQTDVLTPADRAQATQRAKEAGGKLVDELLSSGLVSEDQLRQGMSGLIETLFSSSVEWPDGECAFEEGRPNLDERLTVELAPLSLMLRHGERFPADIDQVRVRIGPPDFRPRSTPLADRIRETLDVADETVDYLLAQADGDRTVGELTSGSPAGEEAGLRAVLTLLRVGALGAPEPASRPISAPGEPDLTEDECRAVLRRADGADYYGVLGLDNKATSAQIRRAYYSVARRYHPDRFRSGTLKHLLTQMEEYFTAVTESYNSLSSPERRKEYDQQLAQLGAAGAVSAESDAASLARQNFLRGMELLARRRLNDAVKFFENALSLDDSQAEFHLELGRLLASNPRRRVDGEHHLREAIRLDPAQTPAYLALAAIYHRAARPDEARHAYEEALRWDPSSVEASAGLEALNKGQSPP